VADPCDHSNKPSGSLLAERLLASPEELYSMELVMDISGYGPVAGSCEIGNEHSGSIKGDEFLD